MKYIRHNETFMCKNYAGTSIHAVCLGFYSPVQRFVYFNNVIRVFSSLQIVMRNEMN